MASLAAGLARALSETGWSARGLSVAAGLNIDAVRNVVRGASTTLRDDRLERIAAVLGIQPGALTGERPWPRRRLRRAPVTEPAPRRRAVESVRISEVDLRPGAPGSGRDIRHRPVATTWTVPADMIEERGLSAEDLVIVRSPTSLGGRRIAEGDRLLVDVGEAARQSTAGVLVISDGEGYELGWVRRVRGRRLYLDGDRVRIEIPVGDSGVCGRVVGRWSWM